MCSFMSLQADEYDICLSNDISYILYDNTLGEYEQSSVWYLPHICLLLGNYLI